MIGPGQAAAAKDADIEPEISSVFLGHYVRRDFGSPENRMRRAVNAALFANPFPIGRIGVFVALGQVLSALFRWERRHILCLC